MIIDFHTHVHERADGFGAGRDASVTALVEQVSRAEIDRAVVYALAPLVSNEFVAAACRQHPGKLLGFASVPPLDPGAAEILEEAVSGLGLRGLKLHPRIQGFGLDDFDRIVPVVERAAVLRIPVVIDAFSQGADWYLRREVELSGRLAAAVPQAMIVMAHAGGHRVQEALIVARACKNVYLDISFTVGFFAGSHVVDDLCFVIRKIGAERILFGSDYPEFSILEALDAARAVLERAGFGEAECQEVLGGNAERILGGL